MGSCQALPPAPKSYTYELSLHFPHNWQIFEAWGQIPVPNTLALLAARPWTSTSTTGQKQGTQ